MDRSSSKLPALVERRITAIAAVAHAWLHPDSLWMKRAVETLPRHTPYSARMVGTCLEATFDGYSEDALRAWARKDLPRRASLRARRVLIIQPATVFAAAWQAATAVWLTGGKVVLKPSRREPGFALLLARSIRKISPTLPIEIIRPNPRASSFSRYHCVIAYGSDNTLRDLSRFGLRLIGFGTRFSIAYVEAASDRETSEILANKAVQDTLLYETQGCLSPHCYYVKEGHGLTAENFGRDLNRAIASEGRRWPQGLAGERLLSGETFWLKWQWRHAQKRAKILGPHVILQSENTFEPCGQPRTVLVTAVKSPSAILNRCREWVHKISTIAFSHPSLATRLAKTWPKKSGVRFAEMGKMHRPDPGWHNSGVNLLRELSAR